MQSVNAHGERSSRGGGVLVIAALVGSVLVLAACEEERPAGPAREQAPTATPAPAGHSPGEAWGGLEVVERGEGDRVFVLLHGYGAPGDDLVPLGSELARAMPGLRVVLPAAPHRTRGRGRAWFDPPISRAGDEAAQAMAQADAAREQLVGVLRTLEAQGVPGERVVVGGFSQGAMMSLDVALRSERPLAGVIALSGGPLPGWEGRWASRAGMPVLLSHGRADRILPFADAEDMRRRLEAGGAEVTWVPFEGGHGIPRTVRARLARFLARVLAP